MGAGRQSIQFTFSTPCIILFCIHLFYLIALFPNRTRFSISSPSTLCSVWVPFQCFFKPQYLLEDGATRLHGVYHLWYTSQIFIKVLQEWPSSFHTYPYHAISPSDIVLIYFTFLISLSHLNSDYFKAPCVELSTIRLSKHIRTSLPSAYQQLSQMPQQTDFWNCPQFSKAVCSTSNCWWRKHKSNCPSGRQNELQSSLDASHGSNGSSHSEGEQSRAAGQSLSALSDWSTDLLERPHLAFQIEKHPKGQQQDLSFRFIT